MKKILIASAAVFIAKVVLDFLVHGVLLTSEYQATKGIWRPDMMNLVWISYLNSAIVAVCLSWIFSKGYEQKGLVEGVRFGVVSGLMISVGFAYGSYMSFNIPYSLALQWFLYSMVEFILFGLVLALVFRQQNDVPAESV